MASLSEGILRWRCGHCGTWNDAGAVTCKKCNTHAHRFDAVQLEDKKSNVEKEFYQRTAPMLLRELRSVLHELELIREKLYGSDKPC